MAGGPLADAPTTSRSTAAGAAGIALGAASSTGSGGARQSRTGPEVI